MLAVGVAVAIIKNKALTISFLHTILFIF